MNCVANGKIIENKIFKNIWIQPASGDAGGSLGAALAYWYLELKKEKVNSKDSMKGSYLGPKYEESQIEKTLTLLGANFKKLEYDNLLNLIADELKKEKAIGWFQGLLSLDLEHLARDQLELIHVQDKNAKKSQFKSQVSGKL